MAPVSGLAARSARKSDPAPTFLLRRALFLPFCPTVTQLSNIGFTPSPVLACKHHFSISLDRQTRTPHSEDELPLKTKPTGLAGP